MCIQIIIKRPLASKRYRSTQKEIEELKKGNEVQAKRDEKIRNEVLKFVATRGTSHSDE